MAENTLVIRIYREDWRYLARLQLEREAATERKPPIIALIHEAVEKLKAAG
jgi:hypothetical protein